MSDDEYNPIRRSMELPHTVLLRILYTPLRESLKINGTHVKGFKEIELNIQAESLRWCLEKLSMLRAVYVRINYRTAFLQSAYLTNLYV